MTTALINNVSSNGDSPSARYFLAKEFNKYFTWLESYFFQEVFKYLSGSELGRCSFVCKSWRSLADRNISWFYCCKNDVRSLFFEIDNEQLTPAYYIQFNSKNNYKDLYKKILPFVSVFYIPFDHFDLKKTYFFENISSVKESFNDEAGLLWGPLHAVIAPIFCIIELPCDICSYLTHKNATLTCSCVSCMKTREKIKSLIIEK